MRRIPLLLATLVLALSMTLPAFAQDGADLFQSCSKCHGADGSAASVKSGGTTLKGQAAATIAEKLMGYKDGSYGGIKKKIMQNMVRRLSDDDIKLLADYISSM